MFVDGVRARSLEDIGTRYDHLRELAGAWEDGLTVLEGRKFPSQEDKDKMVALRSGVVLIDNILGSLGDYHDQIYRIGSLVDGIAYRPDEIAGGRGTPLRSVKLLSAPEYSTEETITVRPTAPAAPAV